MPRLFYLLAASLLLGLIASPALGQPTMLTSQDQPVRIGVTPVYQRYDDGGQVTTQWSTAMDVTVPIGERVRVSASGRAAQSSTDDGAEIRGLDDARLGVAYAQPVGEGSLVGRVDAGIPVGKKELTVSELRTVRATSQSFYDFRVPSFGSGASVVPQLTYAAPVSDRVVVGIGGAYQYLGSYEPVARASRSYDPGDGVEVFGGVDVQMTRASALAVDVRFARYGTARSGSVNRLEPGSSYGGTVQYSYQTEGYTLRVAGRYQNWEESNVRPFVVGPDSASAASRQQLVPSRALVEASYQRRLGDAVLLRVRAGARYFESTDVTARKRLGVFSLRPSVRLTPSWSVTPITTVTAGDLLGLTGGVRTEVRF
jgi:hypothetical protein